MSDLRIDQLSKFFSYPYECEYRPLVTVTGNPYNTVKQSLVHDEHDWMVYSVNFNILTDAQKEELFNFVRVLGGNEDSFLLKDEFGAGYEATRNTIATADGTESVFQLKDTIEYNSSSKQVERWDIIEDSETIWLDGVEQTSGYSITWKESGEIDFGSNVGAGVVIDAEFEYLRRCRFTSGFRSIFSAYNNSNFSLTFAEERPDGI